VTTRKQTPCMNRTARRVTSGLQLIFLHVKRYPPSSMLSHRKNSRALRGRRWTGRGEVRSRELVNSFKNVPVFQTHHLFDFTSATILFSVTTWKSATFDGRVHKCETLFWLPKFLCRGYGLWAGFLSVILCLHQSHTHENAIPENYQANYPNLQQR
jgi:hypothetical protein